MNKATDTPVHIANTLLSYLLIGGIVLCCSSAAHAGPSPATKSAKARAAAKARKAAAKAAFHRKFLQLRRGALGAKKGLLYKKKWVQTSDVKRMLGQKAALDAFFLQGIPRSKRYDALQFVPKKGHYKVAVQVWIDDRRTLQRRWRTHRRVYPNVRDLGGGLWGKPKTKSPVGRASFFANRGRLYYIQFVASHKDALISISCHQSACTHSGPLLALAKIMNARIK